jgi:hypothetical protein
MRVARRGGTMAALGLGLCLLPLTACTSDSPTVGTTTSASAAGATSQLKVMVFNVEYGGDGVDFSSVPKTIEAAGADVVGVEEAWGNIPKIAGALGWPYYDVRMQIVSRYPLLDPPGGEGVYTFVQVAPGKVVAIGNVHLPSAPYGPNLVRDGAKPADVLEREDNSRVPAVTPTVEAMAPLADAGIPSFITGDFNTPSHLDWTQDTVGLRPQVKYPLDWPVSEVVEGAGFHDSFRDVYPDPVTDPGITWPAARPKSGGYNPGLSDHAARDRIDFVYAAGQVRVQARLLDEARDTRERRDRIGGRIAAEHLDRARVAADEAEQHPQGRRLARPVRAEETRRRRRSRPSGRPGRPRRDGRSASPGRAPRPAADQTTVSPGSIA